MSTSYLPGVGPDPAMLYVPDGPGTGEQDKLTELALAGLFAFLRYPKRAREYARIAFGLSIRAGREWFAASDASIGALIETPDTAEEATGASIKRRAKVARALNSAFTKATGTVIFESRQGKKRPDPYDPTRTVQDPIELRFHTFGAIVEDTRRRIAKRLDANPKTKPRTIALDAAREVCGLNSLHPLDAPLEPPAKGQMAPGAMLKTIESYAAKASGPESPDPEQPDNPETARGKRLAVAVAAGAMFGVDDRAERLLRLATDITTELHWLGLADEAERRTAEALGCPLDARGGDLQHPPSDGFDTPSHEGTQNDLDGAELPDEGHTQVVCGAADPAELPERPRPVVALVSSGVPVELTRLDQWVCWAYGTPDPRTGRTPKIPIDPRTGRHASVSDPSTWGTFARALRALDRPDLDLDGIGFVLRQGGRISALDLDKMRDRDTGELHPDAWRALDLLDTYSEVSPSGTGAHAFAFGELPPGRRRMGGVELYDGGRFICVTGVRVEGCPSGVLDRGPELAELHRRVFGDLDPGPDREPLDTPPVCALPDDGLLAVIMRSRDAGLYLDTPARGSSASEGDLCLAGRLVFYCGPDRARVDALFRGSSRMRPKWDTPHSADGRTYGAMTIDRAIAGHRGPHYTGRRP